DLPPPGRVMHADLLGVRIREAEAVALAALARARVGRTALKEVRERPVQVAQRLLQHVRRGLPQERELRVGFDLLEVVGLPQVAHRLTRDLITKLALLKARVIDQPRAPREPPRQHLLMRREPELVTISARDEHTSIILGL